MSDLKIEDLPSALGLFGDRDRMQTESFLLQDDFKACGQVVKAPNEEGSAMVKGKGGTARLIGPN